MARVCTTLTVLAPAAFRIVEIRVSPTSIRLGESTTVSSVVENYGGVAGSTVVRFTANGTEIKRVTTPSISPGTTTTVSFTWAPPEAKTYTVCAELI